LYNFAIKLPLIIGNVLLAYLILWLLRRFSVDKKKAMGAWMFILFNPFILYTTSAWGQFDVIVTILSLASIYFIYKEKVVLSGVFLALAISLKPISIPLLFLPFIYTWKRDQRGALHYLAVLFMCLFIFSVVPFFILGWSLEPILANWDFHFTVAGGMSPFSFLELLEGTYVLPRAFELIGFIWLPALTIGYFIQRGTHFSFDSLIQRAASLLLIFFLTRAWVSEPNINIILPLILILTVLGREKSKTLHLFWIIPLTFTILNTSLPQLFFLSYPPAMDMMVNLDLQIRELRLFARTLVILPWQIIGWRFVYNNLRI
jgi:hypothetical protein